MLIFLKHLSNYTVVPYVRKFFYLWGKTAIFNDFVWIGSPLKLHAIFGSVYLNVYAKMTNKQGQNVEDLGENSESFEVTQFKFRLKIRFLWVTKLSVVNAAAMHSYLPFGWNQTSIRVGIFENLGLVLG